MMPMYLLTFINATHSNHWRVNARWLEVYGNGASPVQLPALRRDKIKAIYRTLRCNHQLRKLWHYLLNVIGYDSPLLDITPVVPALGSQPGNNFLDALMWCVLRNREWIRPLEAWRCDSDDPRCQFRSLVHHLFLNYPVSDFFLSAWFEGYTEEAYQHQNWMLNIGRGGSVQSLDLPIKLTHRAAHLFLTAPAKFALTQGLRRAQVLALGGTPELAAQIAAAFELPDPDEDFFVPFLAMLVRQPPADADALRDLMDYLRFEKMRTHAQHEIFSFQGRTTASLYRDAQEWKRQKPKGKMAAMWRRQELAEVEREQEGSDGVSATWTLSEITTGAELFEEGRQMRNCVFTYLDGCVRGQMSFWSVRCRKSVSRKPRSVMTVEFCPQTRAIARVGVFANGALNPEGSRRHAFAVSLLKEWTAVNQLTLAYEL